MYETIVFDLDGTLLDTLDDLAASVNAALAQCSLPLRTREEVRGFVGNGIVDLMGRASGEENHPKKQDLIAAFKAHYGAHCKDETKPYDGVFFLLKTLREKGAKCAVVSNKADFAVQELSKECFGDSIAFAIGENESAGVRYRGKRKRRRAQKAFS